MATLRSQWFLPTESDEELAEAGLKELESQSVAAPATAPDTDDEDSDLMAWPGWPAFQANLKDRFGKTGLFEEPTFTPPSPPPRPTLVEGGLDGAVVPPERDDAATPAPGRRSRPRRVA